MSSKLPPFWLVRQPYHCSADEVKEIPPVLVLCDPGWYTERSSFPRNTQMKNDFSAGLAPAVAKWYCLAVIPPYLETALAKPSLHHGRSCSAPTGPAV